MVVVPHDAPAWWFNELVAENALAHDSGYEGGQGCAVGANYPIHPTCDEVTERTGELRGEIDDLNTRADYWQDRGDEDNLSAVRRQLPGLRQELRELEKEAGIIPDECYGAYPIGRYQITWGTDNDDEQGGELGGREWYGRLMGWLASLAFTIGKHAVSIMLWLVRLAFSFDVNNYREAVGTFASRLDTGVVHLGDADLSLFEIAWFSLFAYAGFQAIRGRLGRAGGEIAMAVLLAGVGVVLVGNFFPKDPSGNYSPSVSSSSNAYEEGGYFNSFGELINASALAMLRVGNPGTGPDGVGTRASPTPDLNISGEDLDREEVEDLVRSTNQRLQLEFIERPYYLINFGREEFGDEIVDNTGFSHLVRDDDEMDREYGRYPSGEYAQLSCQEVIETRHALDDTSDPWLRRYLRRNGCQGIAEFEQIMTSDRMVAALLVATVAIVMSVGLGLAAVTLLMLKFMAAVLFAALPVAVVMAILPGRSRSLGFGWATSLLQVWLATIGTSMVLALVLLGVDAVNQTSEGRDITERWTMLLLLVGTLFILRKRMVSGAQSVANTLQDRLTAATGDTANWGGGGRRGRMNDMDLAGVDRGAARAGMAGQLAALGGGVMAFQAGAAVGRRAVHLADTPRRAAVAEYGRRRSAALSQGWHWRNSRMNSQLNHARGVVEDPGSNGRGARINAEFGGQTFGDPNRPISNPDQYGILDQRRVAGAAADQDYRRVFGRNGGRRGRLDSQEDRNAMDRTLGAGAADRWNNGDRGVRERMAGEARQARDDAIEAAGGRGAIADRHRAQAGQEINQRNEQGGPQLDYATRTRLLDGETGLNAQQRAALLAREAQLRSNGVLDLPEAGATRQQYGDR